MPPTGHFGTFFATAAEKLLRGLYVRSSRRALCRSEAWVVPQVTKLSFDHLYLYETDAALHSRSVSAHFLQAPHTRSSSSLRRLVRY